MRGAASDVSREKQYPTPVSSAKHASMQAVVVARAHQNETGTACLRSPSHCPAIRVRGARARAYGSCARRGSGRTANDALELRPSTVRRAVKVP